jgi:succinyl-CoA synthetase beta subunit
MDIEDVAHDTPEKIVTVSIDPATGIMPHHGRTARQGAEARRASSPSRRRSCSRALQGVRREGHEPARDQPADRHQATASLRVLDAKVSFDEQRALPSPDVRALRDETEEDAKEIEASKYDLAYVALDGNIGCMVNGAGLAMATMDIIKLYGGSRPTSSTSAAAPARRRSRRRSRSSPPIRT